MQLNGTESAELAAEAAFESPPGPLWLALLLLLLLLGGVDTTTCPSVGGILSDSFPTCRRRNSVRKIKNSPISQFFIHLCPIQTISAINGCQLLPTGLTSECFIKNKGHYTHYPLALLSVQHISVLGGLIELFCQMLSSCLLFFECCQSRGGVK